MRRGRQGSISDACGDDHAGGDVALADPDHAGRIGAHHVRRGRTVEVELHAANILDARSPGHRRERRREVARDADAVAELRIAVPWLEPTHCQPGRGRPAGRATARRRVAGRPRRRGSRPAPPPGASGCSMTQASAQDLLERFPAGPCVARGLDGVRPGGRPGPAPQPVHLVDRARPPAARRARAVAARAGRVRRTVARPQRAPRRHRASRCMRRRPWLALRCPAGLDCTARRARARRRPQPAGPAAGRARCRARSRLVNEAADAAARAPGQRAACGARHAGREFACGCGDSARPVRAAGPARGALLTDDDWLAGLWRLHGGEVGVAATIRRPRWPRARPRIGACVARRPAADAEASADGPALERSMFAPVRARTASNGAVQACVLAARRRRSSTWPRSARWRFWRDPRPLAEAAAMKRATHPSPGSSRATQRACRRRCTRC